MFLGPTGTLPGGGTVLYNGTYYLGTLIHSCYQAYRIALCIDKGMLDTIVHQSIKLPSSSTLLPLEKVRSLNAEFCTPPSIITTNYIGKHLDVKLYKPNSRP